MGTDITASGPEKDGELRQYCSFKISDRLYGFDIQDVKEITTEVALTPIAHAPDTVKGYVNIRGQIHMILDLKKTLGFGSQSYDEQCKVLLFKQNVGEFFGVMVESVGGVISVNEKNIERNKESGTNTEETSDHLFSSEIVYGLYKLPGSILVILRAGRLLETVKTN